jgi:hypothetical protein
MMWQRDRASENDATSFGAGLGGQFVAKAFVLGLHAE